MSVVKSSRDILTDWRRCTVETGWPSIEVTIPMLGRIRKGLILVGRPIVDLRKHTPVNAAVCLPYSELHLGQRIQIRFTVRYMVGAIIISICYRALQCSVDHCVGFQDHRATESLSQTGASYRLAAGLCITSVNNNQDISYVRYALQLRPSPNKNFALAN